MGAAENKQRLEKVFAKHAEGNGRAFLDLLASDVRWTVRGNTEWSGTYDGKQFVITNLMVPQKRSFAERQSVTVDRIIAEDDHVVILGGGNDTTTDGIEVTNSYCWVFRFEKGKVSEVTEHRDSHPTS